MPAPGQQHTAWANPFEEGRQKISEWTAKDIATISARLDKQLGPEYISSRAGPGGTRVHYLTAEKCITLANEVFGFNGWSSSIQNIQVDFADENPQTQRVSIGLSVIVRVTLRDGTYHEDIGYGSIENAKGKAMAFEKAKKEGTTDGLKRALRSFGNVLGNCIYDKGFVSQVTKIKAQPVKKFAEDNLHRHSDFVKRDLPRIEGNVTAAAVEGGGAAAVTAAGGPSLKAEPGSDSFDDFLGELDEADFCVPEDGHPDEVVIGTTSDGHAQGALDRTATTNGQAQGQRFGDSTNKTGSGQSNGRPQVSNNGQSLPQVQRPQPAHNPRPQINNAAGAQPGPAAVPQGGNPGEPVAFFSAKAVSQVTGNGGSGPNTAQFSSASGQHLFNPKAESPSIRKTPGIDHSSSKPLARSGQHVPPPSSQSTSAPAPASNGSGFTPVRPSAAGPQAGRGNVVNPSLDQARRIGAPSGPGSPLANRGSYRPLSVKRPPPGDTNAQNTTRPPLADVPTNQPGPGAANTATSGTDAKRPKLA